MNQDYVYSSERPVGNLPNLFLVADGMGGHNAGDYASRAAVRTIVESASASPLTDPVRILQEAIQAVAATVAGGVLYVANVGDSRLYVAGSQGIRQITRDHSWVEEMIVRGGIGRAEARNHPDKNIITRAVGTEDVVKVDLFEVDLEKEDEILMCTDGLTNMLDDEEISV